jgi:uncharacterized membrane protein
MSTTERSSTGLEANVAGALCYFLGLLSGLIFWVVESQSRFVRFHAMQAMLVSVVWLAILIVYMALWNVLYALPVVGVIAGLFGTIGYFVIVLAWVGAWLYCMLKAFQGERFKLPYLGEFAEKQVWDSDRRS